MRKSWRCLYVEALIERLRDLGLYKDRKLTIIGLEFQKAGSIDG